MSAWPFSPESHQRTHLSHRRRNTQIVEELQVPKPGIEPTKVEGLYAQPFSVQFWVLMGRCINENWRNPGVGMS